MNFPSFTFNALAGKYYNSKLVEEEYCPISKIINIYDVKQLFIKFALPIINENQEIINPEKENPFSKQFFNQNTQ